MKVDRAAALSVFRKGGYKNGKKDKIGASETQ